MSTAARQLIFLGLLLAAVIGLFIAAESGQRQLATATRRVETAALREHALGDVLQVLSEAESGQRGYVLLGDPTYLAPYKEGVERLPAALAGLRDAFAEADPEIQSHVDEIARLSRTKFDEMTETVDLY